MRRHAVSKSPCSRVSKGLRRAHCMDSGSRLSCKSHPAAGSRLCVWRYRQRPRAGRERGGARVGRAVGTRESRGSNRRMCARIGDHENSCKYRSSTFKDQAVGGAALDCCRVHSLSVAFTARVHSSRHSEESQSVAFWASALVTGSRSQLYTYTTVYRSTTPCEC